MSAANHRQTIETPSRRLMRAAAAIAVAILAGQLATRPAAADYNSDLNLCFSGVESDRAPAQISACTRVIESGRLSQKDLGGAYNWRGEGHRILREYELALADYARSIQRYPNSTYPFGNRAAVYIAQEKWDLAIEDATRALRIDPQMNSNYTNRGIAYEKLGDIEKARADFNKAISMPPRGGAGNWAQTTARDHLANLDSSSTPPPVPSTPSTADKGGGNKSDIDLCFSGDDNKAPERVRSCTRVIEGGKLSQRDLASAYNWRGEAHRILEQYEVALADYARSIELNPNSVYAFTNRAEVYRLQEKYELVIEEATHAISIDPAMNASWAIRGMAYEKLGDIEKARADFNKALSLPPKGADGPWGQDIARNHLKNLDEGK